MQFILGFDHWHSYFPKDSVYEASTSLRTVNELLDIFCGHGEYLKVVALVVKNIEYRLEYFIGKVRVELSLIGPDHWQKGLRADI